MEKVDRDGDGFRLPLNSASGLSRTRFPRQALRAARTFSGFRSCHCFKQTTQAEEPTYPFIHMSVPAWLPGGIASEALRSGVLSGDNLHGFRSRCASMMRRIRSETEIPSRAASVLR